MTLDTEGLTIKTYAERRAALVSTFAGLAGGNVATDEGTIEGDLITLFSLGGQELAELMVAVHNAAYPRSANGTALDRALAWLIGDRTEAAASTVTLPVTGTALAVLPVGIAARPVGTTVRWLSTEEITLDGAGAGEGEFEAEVTGATIALADTDWEIATPAVGWSTVGPNAADATEGYDDESDESYRLRGSKALESGDLEAAVWGVDGVTLVSLIENPTGTPDAFWGETHWAEILVVGGTDAAIAAALHAVRGPGRQLLGNTSVAVDAPNVLPSGTVAIKFSRAVEVNVWISIAVTKGEGYPTSTGAEAVAARAALFKAAALAWGEANLDPGQDVYADAVKAAVFTAVPGVKALTVLVGTSDPPGLAEVVIAVRQQADLDSGRIEVTEV